MPTETMRSKRRSDPGSRGDETEPGPRIRILGPIAGGGEISAGILLIGVREEIVKVPGQVLMTGGVEARPAGRVPLLQPARQPIDPHGGPLQVRKARKLIVAADQVEEIIKFRVLNGQGAVGVGFAQG